MNRKQLTIKYEAGHSYTSWFEKTEIYCPNCGKRDVWKNDDGGDHYVGEDYYCLDCNSEFNLPRLSVPDDEDDMNWQCKQILNGLKNE